VAQSLRRELGLADAVAIGLGAILGAGIFVVSGIAAGMAGPAVLISVLLAGVVATANAMSSARLAAEFPQSGGTYEYGYRVLHPWAGFMAGWLFLASKTTAAATVALGFAAYLAPFLGRVPPRAIAMLVIGVFTLLNLRGVRRTSKVNLVIVTITVTTLLAYAGLSLPQLAVQNLQPFAPRGVPGVLEGAALLFFAYTGYARIATLGEEVRDPTHTIPRAIGLTTLLAIGVYALVLLAAVGSAGTEVLRADNAPLAAAATHTLGAGFANALRVAGGIAMLGVLLSQLLGLSRMVFAMARRDDLPHTFAHVDTRHGVPDRAVLAVGAGSAVIAMTGGLAAVAATAAFTILCYYAVTNLAALRLAMLPRAAGAGRSGTPSAARLPFAVPLAGLAGCVALAVFLDAHTIRAGVLVGVAGAAWRMAWRRLRH
jgi:APA family basic amino acid/polyamine antiporter